MEAREYKVRDIVVLELKGRVDEFNTSVLGDELRTILNTGRFRIVVDLSRTSFLSAHCLREIWVCLRQANQLGGDIVLCGAEGAVLETIHFVHFDKVARRYYTIEEAVERFCDSGAALSEAPMPSRWRRFLRRLVLILASGFLLGIMGGTYATSAFATEAGEYALDEVLSLVRETSPQVRMARLKLAEKAAEVQMTRSWSMPRLVGTGGYLYQSNPSILSDVVNREINNVHKQGDEADIESMQSRTKLSFNKDAAIVGMGFSQIVYSGGIFENQVKLREAQEREAEVQIAIEGLAVEEQARNLFLGLLLAREKISFLNSHRSAVEQRKLAARRALEMKTISAVQYSEIELLELKVTQEMLVAEKDERSARGLLNIMLGRPIDAVLKPVPTDFKSDFFLESPDHYFEIALHRYPELRRTMAIMDSAAAYARVVQAQSTFNPQALVFGSMEYSHGLGTVRQDVSWSLGFGVYVPLYDGRKSTAEWEKASALSSQARLSYEAAEQKLRIEIAEVVSEIRKSQLQHELARKTFDIAGKKRAEAQEAVAQGQLPLYRLSEVLSQEMEARISVIAAQSEFYKWRSRLRLLTGQKEL